MSSWNVGAVMGAGLLERCHEHGPQGPCRCDRWPMPWPVDPGTVATGQVPEGAGAVGFYTRETKALFKSVRVCELP